MVGTRCYPNRIDWVLKLRGLLKEGSVSYKGTWNASTNKPAIPKATDGKNTAGGNMCQDSAGNKGWYFVVSVAGTTNIDGINDWQPGDWIISNGDKWEKVDNSDVTGVLSVNNDFGPHVKVREIYDSTGTYIATLPIMSTNDVLLLESDPRIHKHHTDTFIINGTDLANGYLLLTFVPKDSDIVKLEVEGAPSQFESGIDFIMDSVIKQKLILTGYGLDGKLSIDERVKVRYLI